MVAEDELERSYRTQGYAIARALFTPAETASIAEACDRVHAAGIAHGRPFRHGNLFFNIAPAASSPVVRMVQWPSWIDAALAAQRIDPRYAALLAPLIGAELKQIINQIHWKPTGQGSGGDFAWHQDSRSRRPREAYRALATSYVQTGLAIDPHTPESGCLQVIPGSHLLGDLAMAADGAVLGKALSDADLLAAGLDPAGKTNLLLQPGDVALWSPYLVHASGINRSNHARRLLINGYVTAANCDRGEWAFRGGLPVPLGASPSLVHYEALHDRPEPHYPQPHYPQPHYP